jgi:hypothetical protein
MLFSVKELADFFCQDEQWVYNIVFRLGIKPIYQKNSDNGLCKINFYSDNQKKAIELYLRTQAKNVIVIENNYHIYQSRMNFKELEQL